MHSNSWGIRRTKSVENIEGVPVQFLPAYNALVEEALAQAADTRLGTTFTRVLSPEFLAAIMVQTGRSKDRQRLTAFLEQADYRQALLEDILGRHQLLERFRAWTTPPNL